MKHFAYTATAALAAGLAFASLATADDQMKHDQQSQQDSAQMSGAQMSGQTGQQQQPLTKDDEKRYIKNMSSANQLEIQLGEYVQGKNVDPQIKQLAQRTADEHRQANDQLKQLAQQTGNEFSDDLNEMHKAVLDQMKDVPEKDLGREYVFWQVGNHQHDLLKNQFVAANAQDPNIKNYARQTADKLQQHYQHAQQLAQTQFGAQFPTAQPAGAVLNGQSDPSQQQPQQQQQQDWQDQQNQQNLPGQSPDQGGSGY